MQYIVPKVIFGTIAEEGTLLQTRQSAETVCTCTAALQLEIYLYIFVESAAKPLSCGPLFTHHTLSLMFYVYENLIKSLEQDWGEENIMLLSFFTQFNLCETAQVVSGTVQGRF